MIYEHGEEKRFSYKQNILKIKEYVDQPMISDMLYSKKNAEKGENVFSFLSHNSKDLLSTLIKIQNSL